MHIPFPCGSSLSRAIAIPGHLALTDSHILLFVLACVLLLLAFHTVLRVWTARLHTPLDITEKGSSAKGSKPSPSTKTAKDPRPPSRNRTWTTAWTRGICMRLESLPITLEPEALRSHPVVGTGSGILNSSLVAPPAPSSTAATPVDTHPHRPNLAKQWYIQHAKTRQRGRSTRPAFDYPLPALYQTEEPVSMAKMIMSRHTFRRPTPGPNRRSMSLPPSRRRELMPIPQPSSETDTELDVYEEAQESLSPPPSPMAPDSPFPSSQNPDTTTSLPIV